MSSPPRNANLEYVQRNVAIKKNSGANTFKTTYGCDYPNLPTEQVAPLITEYYKYYGRPDNDPHADLSPYPLAYDGVESKDRRPYQLNPNDYLPPGQERPEYDERKTRFERVTLKRDQWGEGLPPNRNYISREGDPPRHDPRDDTLQFRQEEGGYRDSPGAGDPQRYDQQLAGGPQEELKKVFCNKCFKSDCCMNRLTCAHQYCDECMSSIPVQDRQFRDSIRWHYCCEICQKLTSDPKLTRVDPLGRRLLRYHDVDTFGHAKQQH